MAVQNEEPFIQIYLFDSNGEFFWCNGSANVDVENQGVLHAGLFATLYRFSMETLGEKLNYLLINELRINLFSLAGKFLIAIVTPKFLRLDPRQLERLKIKIGRKLNSPSIKGDDEMIDLISKDLNVFLQDLLDWVQLYIFQADRAMNILTNEMDRIENTEVGAFLYTWDSNRIFKYVPSSNTIDFQIEELIDSSINNLDFLSNLDRSVLIQNNTIIYFLVGDLILILTKTYEKGNLEENMIDLMDSSRYFEDILEQVTNIRSTNLN